MCTGNSASRVAALIAFSLALAGIADAQQTASGTLEEVIVTARKVQENQQDTPIAITALTGDALIERQVFDTTKLTQVVPNLQFANNAPLAGNNSSSQIFIRGIGQTDPTSTVDPGVGLYIDDVYIGNAVGGSMGLRDIASAQVLRGPQGTLFGRNTIGGAILLSTVDPGDDFGGTARVGFGSDSLIDVFGALDAPISEHWKARFSAGLRKQDGYVTRADGTDLGDTNTYTVQAKLLWKPTEKVTGRFLLDYTNSDENGSPLVFSAINEAATFPRVASQDAGCPGVVFPASGPVPMIDDPRCANDFQGAGPYHNNGTDPLTSQFENWGSSLTFSYQATEAVALKSISSYRGLSWAGNRDADNTPLPILGTQYDVDGWQWSQELQLVYQTEALTGVAGAYYFDQGSDDIVTVALNPPPPGVQHDSDNNQVANSSWAVFTQWTFNFNKMFALTAGGRYTEDRKGSYPDQYDLATPNVKQVPVQWYRDTFSSFTPSGSLRLRFNDSAMVYLSYSEGFKGGGWNSHFNSVLTPAQQAALQEFKQEEANTTELGFKLDLAGNTLRLNGAIFTSDYKDMQITYRGPCTPPAVPGNPPVCGVAPFLTNAGKASIDGAELEATWAPTSDWLIEASFGYLDATLDKLVTPVDANGVPVVVLPPGLVEGNALPFAPKYQGHFGIAWTAHAGSFALTPRLDLSYQDTTYFDATDTVEIAQLDSYTVLNASFVFGPAEGKWNVTLGVNNATDETYPIAGNSSLTTGSGYAEIAYSRPREYFGLFTYKF